MGKFSEVTRLFGGIRSRKTASHCNQPKRIMAALTKPAAIQFPPLEQETRPCVPTAQAAHYLTLTPQTLREWACYGKYPDILRPVRVGSRLAWPVAGIRALLGVH